MAKNGEVAEAVVRACKLLKSFRHEGETLTLSDLVAHSGLSKTTTFRLAQSLVRGGLLERIGRGTYRSQVRPLHSAGYRVGFAAQTTDSEFSKQVSARVRRAADGSVAGIRLPSIIHISARLSLSRKHSLETK